MHESWKRTAIKKATENCTNNECFGDYALFENRSAALLGVLAAKRVSVL
jgi:hypothetical protein